MQHTTIHDVIRAIENVFPPHYQEDYDNTGLQLGDTARSCSGVLVCVDVTTDIIDEARQNGCNLIVAHHPLIFHPLKRITSVGRVDNAICQAIKDDIAIYACHTSADNTPLVGVSWKMGQMLGLSDIQVLEHRDNTNIGSGIVGNLPQPLSCRQLVEKVKATFHAPVARCSALTPADALISRIALCGGAGSFLLPTAIDSGAQAFIASDCKHNNFIDHAKSIFLIDIGHFESEECTKQIFYQLIRENFPNFAVRYSQIEKNPIIYL